MSHRQPLVAFVVASVAFSSLAFVGRVLGASPTTCTSDSDCQRGFTCQPWAVSGGTAPACPADAPDCAVITDKPPSGTGGGATGGAAGGDTGASGAGNVSGGSTGAGNTSGSTPPTTVISRCAPGPCQADSDCGSDMVCHTESYTECSGGAAVAPCPPNTKCDPTTVPDPTCVTKTSSLCTFHWQLPCNADVDCGAGFTCQPRIFGSCSGGGPVSGGTGVGVGGSGGSASEPVAPSSSPPDNCTTMMTFPGSCQPTATVCNVDTDCPADWVCQDVVTRGSPGTANGAGTSSVGGGGAGAATGAIAADVVDGTGASSRMCVSPFIPPSAAKDATGEGGRVGGTEGTGTGTSGSTPPGATAGTGGTTAGGPSGAATGGAGGGNGATLTGDAPGASNGAGGCSVGGAGAPAGAGVTVLALLGLGIAVRRRRR